MTNGDNEVTHFGYSEVPVAEKTKRVNAVFDSVAQRYDLMNDLMSFGLHRWWKRFTVNVAAIRAGERVLDLAAGTGDLARQLAKKTGDSGEVVVSDINWSMLDVGRERLTNRGLVANMRFVQADAEDLPFPDRHFDLVTIGFGLRNVTDKDAALASIYRVLKPGGRLLVLEFSKPRLKALSTLYDAYSFAALPVMGRIVAKDAESYQYLAESIRVHPDQDSLEDMLEQAGFEQCDYFNMMGGIVALHRGYRL